MELRCASCGHENPDARASCPTCGLPLDVNSACAYLRERVGAVAPEGRTPWIIRLAEVTAEAGDLDGAYLLAARAFEETQDDSHLGGLLARLAEGAGRWDALLWLYETTLQPLGRDPASVPLRLRLASWYAGRDDPDDRAATHLGRAAEIAPKDPVVLEAMADRHGARGDSEHEVAALRRMVDSAADEVGRRHALRRLVDAHRRAEHPDDAVAAWRALLSIDPADDEAFAEVDRAYTRAERWAELADVLEARSDLDATNGVAIRLRAAELHELHTGEQERAVEGYRRVLEIEPDHEASLRALVRLYEKLERVDDLLGALQALELHLEDDAERLVLLRQQADLHARGGDLEAAADRYRDMLGVDRNNSVALHALEHIYREREEWPPLAAVYERLIEQADEGERAELQLALARLYAGPLDDVARAIDRLQGATDRSETLELLAELYGRDGAWDRAAEVLEQLAGTDDPPPGLDGRLVTIHAEQRHDPRAAFAWAARGFVERGGDPDVLEALASAAEHEADLPGLFAQAAERHPEHARDLLRRRARWLTDPEEAERAWRDLLAVTSDDVEALAALDHLLTEAERWRPLAAVIGRRVDADPASAESLLWRSAGLHEGPLASVHAAIELYRRLLDLHPGHAGALSRLAVIHESQGDWSALYEVYARQVEVADDETRFELRARMAEIAEAHLDEPVDAVRLWEGLLEADPTDLEAYRNLARIHASEERWPDVVEVLERRLEHEDSAARIRTRLALADAYERALGDDERAFAVLTEALADGADDAAIGAELARLADTVEDGWARAVAAYVGATEAPGLPLHAAVALRLRLAGWCDVHTGDAARAEGWLGAALELHPDHAGALALLEAFLLRQDRLADAIAVVERQSELAPAEGRRAYLVQIAELQVRIDDAAAAAATWERVRAVDPEDAEALSALASLYAELGRREALVAVLGDYEPTPEEAVEHFVRLGGLLRAQAPARASDAYRRAIEVDEGCVEAIDALIEIYRALGDTLHTAQMLERRLGLEVADPLTLRAELAALYRGPLEAPGMAVGVLEGALEADPQHAVTLHALGELAAELGDWPRAVEMLGREANARPAGPERLACERRAARVFEDHLADAGHAFEWAVRVFVSEPSDAGNREEVARLAAATGRRRDLAMAYATAAERTDDAALRRELMHAEARIVRDVLADAAGAELIWRRLLEEEPNDVSALAAIDALLDSAGRDDELSAVVARRAALAEGEAAVALRLRLGRLYETLERPVEAISAYRRVVMDGEAHQPEALERLAALLEAQGEWPGVYEALEGRLEGADADLAPRLRARMAELAEAHLGRPDDAIARWREVLLARPDHAQAELALERLYQKTGAWAPLADLFRRRLERADDGLDRAATYARLATVLEVRHDDLEAALSVRCEQFVEAPDDESLGPEIERLAFSADAWDAAVDAYERALEVIDALPLHLRVAGWYEAHLGGAVDAVRHYRAVLELDPTRFDVEDALITLLEDDEQWEALAALLETRADRVDPETRRALLSHVASIATDRIDDPDRAIAAWLRVLRDDLGDLDAWRSLAPLYERCERWLDLHEVHEELATLVQPREAAIAHYLAAARIAQVRLDDVERAEAAYAAALELDVHDRDVIDGLGHLLEAQERWEDVTAIHQRRLDAGLDAEQERRVRGVIVELCRGPLGDLERAVDALMPLLRDGPDRPTLETLIELFAEAEDWLRCVDATSRLAYVATDAAELHELRMRVGALYSERLDDQARAFDWYASAWREHPDDEALTDTLDAVAEAGGRLPDLAAAMQHAWPYVSDPRRLGHRLVELQRDRCGDIEATEATLRVLLERDPADTTALGALSDLLAEQERWGEHAATLERLASLAEGEARAPLFLRAAHVRATWTGEIEAAVALYRRVLDDDPRNEDAVSGLSAVYLETEAWPELLALLELRTDAAEGDARLPLLVRRADLLEVHLERPAAAVELWREVRALDPEGEAEVRLEALYGTLGRWDDLVGLLRDRLGRAEGDARSVAYARLALVLEEDAGDPEGALAVWCEAFAESTDDRLAPELERLARATGDWEPVLAAYEAAVGGEPPALTGEAAHALRLRLGSWLAELGEVDRAAEHFEMVLAAEPRHAGAMAALTALVQATGDAERLARLLRRRADLADDPAQRKAELVRLAYVLTSRLEDPERAAAAWRTILEDDDADLEAWRALAPLCAAQERWPEQTEAHERAGALEGDPVEQRRHLRAAAELAWERLGDGLRAARSYEAALATSPPHGESIELRLGWASARRDDAPAEAATALLPLREADPHHEGVLETLAELYEAGEDWPAAIESHEALVELALDPELRAARLRGLARLCVEGPADTARALHALTEAMGLVPSDPSLAAAAREQAEAAGALRVYAEALYDARDAVEDDDALDLARSVELAHLYVDLEDHEAAAEAWQRVLLLEPDDRAALAGLQLAFETLGRTDALPDVVARRAELEQDPALYLRLGMLWEAAGDDFGAEQAYGDAGEEGARRLVALYERTGERAALYDVLGRLPPETEIAIRRGRLAQSLDRDADAAERWREVLAEQPDDDEAARGLEVALVAIEDWAGLRTALRARLERTEDPGARRLVYLRMAGAWSEPGEALAVLLAGFIEQPGPGLSWEIASLANTDEAWAAVEAAYDGVIGGLEGEAGAPFEVQLAEWACARGDDAAGELRYEEALVRAPAYGAALDGLERLIQRSGEPGRVADWLERRAAMDADPQSRKARRVRLAYLAAGPLDDPARALLAWDAVLGDDAEDVDAWRAIPALYERLGSWPEVADALERLAGAEEAERHLRRAAEIAVEQLDDVPRAVRCLERALEAGPQADVACEVRLRLADLHADPGEAAAALSPARSTHPDDLRVTEKLVELYEQAGADDELTEVLMRLCGAAPTPERWSRLAELRAPSDPGGALDALLAAMALAPEDAALTARAAPLAEATDRLEVYACALEEARGAVDDAALQEARSLELGGLYARLERHADAEQAWRDALAHDPEQLVALAGLQAALAAQDKGDEIADVLALRAQLTDDPALHLALGALWEAAGDDFGAEQAYGDAGEEGARRLVALYERTGERAALYDVLGRLPPELEIAARRARLAQSLDRDADAIERWREVLAERPDDDEAARGLEVSLVVCADWAGLRAALRARLERTEDPGARRIVYLRMAGAWSEPGEALAVLLAGFVEQPGPALAWEIGQLASADDAWAAVEVAYDGVLAGLETDAGAPFEVQLAEWACARGDDVAAELRYEEALVRAPTYGAALDGLERLIERGGEPARVADWLERRAATDADPQSRKARRVRLAYLAAGPLDDPARALLAWDAVLEDAAEDVDAWRAIPALYERLGSWPEVADALERLAGAEEPERHLRRAAEIAAEQLDDAPRAVRCLEGVLEAGPAVDAAREVRLQIAELHADPVEGAAALSPALQTHPDDLAVMEKLVELYEQAGADDELLGVLPRLCGAAPTPERWSRLAELRAPSDPGGALDALLAAMALAPEMVALTARAAPLAEATDRLEVYACALDEARGAADDAALHEARSLELGGLYVRLARHADAEQAWRDALVHDPEHTAALAGLQAALEAQDKVDEVADVLALRAQLTDDPALHLALGELWEAGGDDFGAAQAYEAAGALGTPNRVALCERLEDWAGLYDALGDLPAEPEIAARRARIAASRLGRHADAVERWREVLADQPTDDEGTRGLEHALEVLERWGELVSALRARLERTSDAEARRRIYERIASAVRDPGAALDVLLEAFGEGPDVALAPDLGTLAAQSNGWSRVWTAFDDAITAAEGAATLPFQLQLAAWSVDRGLLQAAERRYEAALAVEPGNREALEGLEAIVESGEDPARLADWLERRALLEDTPAGRRQRWARVAGLAAGPLSDPERAARAWRSVLADDPNDPEGLRALPLLYEQLERWGALADSLESLAAVATPIGPLKRAAEVALERLDDPERAAANYEQALASDPPIGEALALRLRLAAVRRDASPAVAAQTLRPALELDPADVDVLGTLADLYEAAEDDAEAVSMLERLMAVAPDVAGWRRIAGLVTDPVAAESAWRAVLDLTADAPDALLGLQTALESQSRGEEADDVLLRRAEVLGEAELYVELADRYEGRFELEEAAAAYDAALALEDGPDLRGRRARLAGALEWHDEAIEDWRAVLAARPDDRAARAGLEASLTVLERWEELAAMLRGRLEGTEAPAERRDLYLRIAGALPEPADSLAALLETFAEAPDDALSEDIGRVAGRCDGWEAVTAAYEAGFEHVEGTDAVPLHLRCAGWYTDLRDISAAERHYEAVLEAVPKHPGALEALSKLIQTTGDFLRIADVLERKAELTDDPQSRKATRVRLAYLATSRLDDAERAVGAWEALLEDDPEDMEAWRALPPLYERLERWPELVVAVEKLGARDRFDRVRYLMQAARISLEHLDEPERARANFEAALEAEPTDAEQLEIRIGLADVLRRTRPDEAAAVLEPILSAHPDHAGALASLSELYAATEAWAEAAAVQRRLVDLADDDAGRAERLSILARTCEAGLDDPAGALVAWVQALDAAPADETASREAARLAAATDRLPVFAAALERARAAVADEAPELDRSRSAALGAIHADLQAHHEAEAAWRRVLGYDADDEVALAGLQAALEATDRDDEAMEVLRRRCEHSDDPALWRDRARAEAEAEAAACAWRRVLAAEPDDAEAADGLEGALEAQEDWAALAEALRARLDRSEDVDARRSILTRIAAAARDPGDALDALLEAFAEAPDDAALGPDVGIRAAEASGWARAASAYRAAAEAAGDEAAPLWARLAGWYEGPIDDPSEAAACYERLRTVDPEHPRVLDALQASYEKADDWAGLVRVLEERTPVPDTLARVARLKEEQLEDNDGAVTAWARVLEAEPDRADAVLALSRLYEGAGDTAALLELSLDHPDAEAGVHARAAVAAEGTGDVDAAIAAWRRAGDGDAVERVCLEGERFGELAEVYAERGDDAALADLCLGPLDDAEAAATALDRLLAVEPDDAKRREQRLALAEAAEDQETIAAQLAALGEIKDDPAVWTRLAELRERQLDDPAGAFEAHGRALRRVPDSEPSFTAVMRLGEARQLELAALLSEVLPSVEAQTRKVAIERALAEAYGAIDDPEGAERALRDLLARDPKDDAAVDALSTLLRAQGRWADVTAVYAAAERWEGVVEGLEAAPHSVGPQTQERAYRETGSWANLAEVYEARLGDDDDPEVEAELVALYRGPLEDPAAAVQVLLRTLGRDPGNVAALRGMVELAEVGEDWGTCVDALGRLAEVTEKPADAAALLRRASTLCEEKVGDSSAAFDWMGLAFQADPTDEAVREACVVLATDSDRKADLAAVYDGIARTNHDVQVVRRLRDLLATLYFDELGDRAAAERTWEALLEREPKHVGALDGLAKIYEADEKWVELAVVLQRQINAAEPIDDRVALRLRVAEVYERRLGQAGAAVAQYEMVLDEQPDHVLALRALARLHGATGGHSALYETLEKLLAAEADEEALIDVRRRLARTAEELEHADEAIAHWRAIYALDDEDDEAGDALDRLLEASGRWGELAEHVERRLVEMTVGEDAVKLHLKLATWYERSEARSAAAGHYLDVLALDSEHPQAKEALDRIFERPEDWPEAIAVLEQQLEGAPDDTARLRTLRQLARIRGEGADVEAAIADWRSVLEISPKDVGAMDALAVLFEKEKRWDDMLNTREMQAIADPSHAAELLKGAAEVAEVHAPARVTDLLETAQFSGADVADTLARVYFEQEKWDELAALYGARLAEKDDPETRTALADVFAVHLDEPGRAYEVLVPTLDPGAPDLGTLARLAALAERAEDWTAHAEMLSRQAYLLQEREAQLAVRRRVAEVYRDKLEEPGMAFDWYGSALQMAPADESLRVALCELADQTERWADVVAQLWAAANHTDDTDARRALGLAMARLYRDRLDAPQQAVGMYDFVLGMSPDDPEVLDEVADVLEASEQWKALVSVLERLLEWVDDPDIRSRLAVVLEAKLGKPEKAKAHFIEVLEARPNDTLALGHLEKIHAFQGDWAGLHDLIERHVRASGDDASVDLLRRLAQVSSRLQKPDATDRWMRVLQVSPGDEEATAGLALLYEANGRWDELIAMLRANLSDAEDAETRAAGLMRIAELYETRCDDENGAFEVVCAAFEASPDDDTVGVELERLAGLTTRWANAAKLYAKHCGKLGEVPEAAPYHMRLARWYRTYLDRGKAAVEHARAALRLSGDAVAGDELEQLLEDAGEWKALAKALERRPIDGPTLLRLARIRLEHLDDAEGAVEAAERVLVFDPASGATLQLLDGVYRKLERWHDLADLYERQLEATDDKHAEVHLRGALAELYRGPLNDLRKAVETLTPLPRSTPQTVDTLLELHIQLQDWNQVAGMLIEQEQVLHPGAKKREKQIMIAHIFRDDLLRPAEAVTWLAKAWASRPDDEDLRAELRSTAEKAEAYEALVAAYWDGLRNTRDSTLIRSASLEMAAIYRNQLDDLPAAEGLYQYVLQAIDPDDAAALAGLESALAAQGKWRPMFELLQQRLEAAGDESTRKKLRVRLRQVSKKLKGAKDGPSGE